jgi:hypothetical protein
VGRSILDGDVLRAGKVALKLNDFEVLHVEGEEVGLLLVDHCEFLADLDAGEELLHLLLVQLHIIIKIIIGSIHDMKNSENEWSSLIVTAKLLERWQVLTDVRNPLAGQVVQENTEDVKFLVERVIPSPLCNPDAVGLLEEEVLLFVIDHNHYLKRSAKSAEVLYVPVSESGGVVAV